MFDRNFFLMNYSDCSQIQETTQSKILFDSICQLYIPLYKSDWSFTMDYSFILWNGELLLLSWLFFSLTSRSTMFPCRKTTRPALLVKILIKYKIVEKKEIKENGTIRFLHINSLFLRYMSSPIIWNIW